MSDFNDPLKNVDPSDYIQKRREEAKRIELYKSYEMFVDLYNKRRHEVNKNREETTPSYYELESGEVLHNVHQESKCAGSGCAIHHPSDHPLKAAPRIWELGMVWRECRHGAHHPDFDSVANLIDRDGEVTLAHNCCRGKCCGLPEWIDIRD